MKKYLALVILLYVTAIIPCSYANTTELTTVFHPDGASATKDDRLITKAENLHKKLLNVTESSIEQIKEMAGNIINPFLSKLPKPEPAPAPIRQTNDIRQIRRNDTEGIAAPPSAQLSGLVWNSAMPQAILNNKIVNVGDNIDGWIIDNISKEGVLLKSTDNQEYLIKP